MNFIVTGSDGFIGSQLTRIIHDSYQLSSADFVRKHLEEHIKHIYLSGGKTIQGIFHLGAWSRIHDSNNNFKTVMYKNIDSLNHVLEVATQHNIPVVFTSTSYNFVNPYANAYAVSKLMGEELCKYYRKVHGTKVYVVRLSNVYGNLREDYPEYKLGVVDLFLKKWKNKQEYIINNGGNQTRDYIHVNDVCSNLLKIMLSGKDIDWDKNEYIPICSEQVYSVNNIRDMIFDYPPTNEISVSGEIESCPIKNTHNLPIKHNLKEYIKFVKDGIFHNFL